MDVDRVLRNLLKLELAALAPLVVMVPLISLSAGFPPWIYELFGALSAASITTFGLWKMKNLTE